MPESLQNKVAFVTGASSGIGRATSLALADAGSNVVLFARSKEKLEAISDRLGIRVLVCAGDVTCLEDLKSAVQRTLDHFGRIDILFANAGIYLAGDISSGDPAAWSQVVDVNVKGVFFSVSAVLPCLLNQKSGDIIVCSSISGHEALPWEPVYSASKHAIQSFVHGLRRQLLKTGVRVGAIAPGTVLNELWGMTDEGEIRRRAQAGEGLQSEDVAEAVLFMLTRPRNITIRDLVMLPRARDL